MKKDKEFFICKKARWILICCYLVFLISPSLMYYLANNVFSSLLIPFLIFQLACLCLPFMLWPTSFFLVFILTFPFLLLTFFQWGHYWVYSYELTAGGFAAILETNPNEAFEFLQIMPDGSLFISGLLFFFFLAIGAFFMRVRLGRRGRGDGFFTINKKIKYFFLAVIPLFFSLKILQYKDLKKGFAASFGLAYPFKNISSLYLGLKEVSRFKKSLKNNKTLHFSASYRGKSKDIQHILVIGESSRKGSWQLYGHGRATNEKLSQIKDLLLFEDTISASNTTIKSLELSLTFSHKNKRGSLMDLAQEAGFRTYWLSNQAKFGEFDTAISVLAATANETFFINTDTSSQSFDENILPHFERLLHRAHGRGLIILHLMGSHFYYNRRYPKKSEKFNPHQLIAGKTPKQSKIINEYDNTIVYTDNILAKIIGLIKEQKRPISLTFFSDHGEALFGDGKDFYGHGGPVFNAVEVEVPMFFVANESYYKSHELLYESMKKAAFKKVSLLDFFSSYGEILEIDFPLKGESFMSGEYGKKKRRVVVNIDGIKMPYFKIKELSDEKK